MRGRSRDSAMKTQGKLEQAEEGILIVADLFCSAYMVFLIAVLPLYNRGGYEHIGTEKAALLVASCRPFLQAVVLLWLCLLPVRIMKRLRRDGKSAPGKRQAGAGLLHFLKGISATDCFVCAYGAAVLLSYRFSAYRETALMGRSGWGMGALAQLCFVALYFTVSRLWSRRRWLLYLFYPVTLFLFILGFLNRFGIYPIPMSASGIPSFISLAGNINWYCGYMVMPVFAAVCFFWCGGCAGKAAGRALAAYLFVCFCALVTNGSSSGILTLCFVFLLLLVLSLRDTEHLRRYGELVVLLASACLFTMAVRLLFPEAITYREPSCDWFTYSAFPAALLAAGGLLLGLTGKWKKEGGCPVKRLTLCRRAAAACLGGGLILFPVLLLLNTLRPGSIGPLSGLPVFTFSESWGSSRGATWKVGALVWKELPGWKKLIGVGSDCMGIYLQQDAGAELKALHQRLWPSASLTNAHNELLTLLVQNGVLGAAAFAGILGSAIARFWRTHLLKAGWGVALIASCGMAAAAYAVHNLFSFQQVLNGPALFVILGIGEAYLKREKNILQNR